MKHILWKREKYLCDHVCAIERIFLLTPDLKIFNYFVLFSDDSFKSVSIDVTHTSMRLINVFPNTIKSILR